MRQESAIIWKLSVQNKKPKILLKLSYWNTDGELQEREDGTKDKWTVAEGERTVYVGAASDNLILQENIDVQ